MGAKVDSATIGKLALELRLITQAQLDEALAVQACYGAEKTLSQVMLDLRYLSAEEIAWIEGVAAMDQPPPSVPGVVRPSGGSKSRPPAARKGPPGPPPARSATAQPAMTRAQATTTKPGVAPPGRPPPPNRAAGTPPPPKARAASASGEGSRHSRLPAPPSASASTSGSSSGEAPRGSQPSIAPAPPPGQRALDKMLAQAMKLKASDVHIHAGAQAQLRVNGKLFADKSPPLEPAKTEAVILEILTSEQRKTLLEKNDLDFVYAIPGAGRFRANVYRQLRGIDAVFRYVPPEPPTLDELGLSRTLAPITKITNGLILLTGPAGCGKSSTMAAFIDHLNTERAGHIITIEDPIEFVHKSRKALVTQRQVNKHTGAFATALRAALRQHPDVLAIGELRDLESISLAVTAAETGHLVLATLHTNNAVRSINRILDVFPPKQQPQIRSMLSDSIRAVVSQRLLPSADGNRRIPVVELLLVTHAVSNMIREEKVFQIRSVLQTAGRAVGMVLLDDALAELVRMGAITKEVAKRHADDPKIIG